MAGAVLVVLAVAVLVVWPLLVVLAGAVLVVVVVVWPVLVVLAGAVLVVWMVVWPVLVVLAGAVLVVWMGQYWCYGLGSSEIAGGGI
jgi:hypothetical protein